MYAKFNSLRYAPKPKHSHSTTCHLCAWFCWNTWPTRRPQEPAPRCLARLTLYLQKRLAGHVGECVARCGADWEDCFWPRLFANRSSHFIGLCRAAASFACRVSSMATSSQSLSRLIPWRFWFSTMGAGRGWKSDVISATPAAGEQVFWFCSCFCLRAVGPPVLRKSENC